MSRGSLVYLMGCRTVRIRETITSFCGDRVLIKQQQEGRNTDLTLTCGQHHVRCCPYPWDSELIPHNLAFNISHNDQLPQSYPLACAERQGVKNANLPSTVPAMM